MVVVSLVGNKRHEWLAKILCCCVLHCTSFVASTAVEHSVRTRAIEKVYRSTHQSVATWYLLQ